MPRGIYKRTKEHGRNISKAKKGKRTSKSTEFKKGHGKIRSDESYKEASKKHRGKNHGNYKTGIHKSNTGYLYRLCDGHPSATKGKTNYIAVHRLMMEEHLDRYLTCEEIVHHINGIRDDNRIENLILFNNVKEHLAWHKEWK